MFKKILTGAFGLSLLTGVAFTDSADAAVYTNGKHSFSSSWHEKEAPTENSLIKFGFNTDWINEDYTWTTDSGKKTWAYVHNNDGEHSDSASAASWAKVEVKHSGSSVKYEIKF